MDNGELSFIKGKTYEIIGKCWGEITMYTVIIDETNHYHTTGIWYKHFKAVRA